MTTRKKTTIKEEATELAHDSVKEKKIIKPVEEVVTSTGDVKEEDIKIEAPTEEPVVETAEKKALVTETKKSKKGPKYPVGSIVYISKDVEADLNGFNLFISQYKRETYTVEAYDADTGIYTLRHLKLLLRLTESDLVAPNANAHDELNRMQF